jgi:hypothetical protein
MGCDIHLMAEVRKNGKWKKVEGEFYDDRNYELFAILADVRNRFGIKPICQPKGFPDNTYQDLDFFDGTHSASYFTVQEILEYDWTQTCVASGNIPLYQYLRWKRWGKNQGENPSEFNQGVSGQNVKILDTSEADKIDLEHSKTYSYPNEAYIEQKYPSHYVRAEWTRTYYAECSDFLSERLPQLWRLGKPEDVRIVFSFDN